MIEKDSKEFELWADAYKLKSKYTPAQNGDENPAYWQQLYDETHEVMNKYKKTEIEEFAEQIFLAIWNQLERQERKMKNE